MIYIIVILLVIIVCLLLVYYLTLKKIIHTMNKIEATTDYLQDCVFQYCKNKVFEKLKENI